MIPESLESLEPYRFDGRTARVLGLPLLAVTPNARLVANRTEWLWFDPAEGLAIWRGPDGQHGFPASFAGGGARLRGAVGGEVVRGRCPSGITPQRL